MATTPTPLRNYDSQPQSGSTSFDWKQSVAGFARDFLIDVLGSLVGILFIIAVCALVITSGTCFLDIFGQSVKQEPTFTILLKGNVDAFHSWILFIVAYVVGGIFHRLDPETPDRKSLERELRALSKDDKNRFEVQKIDTSPLFYSTSTIFNPWFRQIRIWYLALLDKFSMRHDRAYTRVEAAELALSPGAHFPYSHTKQYFVARDLMDLAGMVRWSGTDTDWKKSSKTFLNTLKIRMQWVAPRKCGEIVRNEAHIRMMSSVWFAAKSVFHVFYASLLPVAVALWYRFYQPSLKSFHQPADAADFYAPFYHDCAVYIAVASFAFISAFWLMRRVESRFHYWRFKEVIYVLETAFCIKNDINHENFMDNLP